MILKQIGNKTNHQSCKLDYLFFYHLNIKIHKLSRKCYFENNIPCFVLFLIYKSFANNSSFYKIFSKFKVDNLFI